jgi:hypothetical protein
VKAPLQRPALSVVENDKPADEAESEPMWIDDQATDPPEVG